MTETETLKRFAVTQELDLTKQILDEGLNSLDRINFGKDHYYVVFLLIANGLERLLKITIILGLFEKLGHFPTEAECNWRKKGARGHNLETLVDQVTETCYSPKWKANKRGKTDFDYLIGNKLFRKVLKVVSDFGVGLRYANLNIILGKESVRGPEQVWQKMELDLFMIFDPDMVTLSRPEPEKSRDIYSKVIQLLSDSLRHGIGSIARLYTMGELSPLARQASPLLSGYYQFIKDSVLSEDRSS
ncbi:MAG: hypothetical protein IIA59_06050 [Candidatus Marinimicrobia bacterium]|nr:hypothetical protein [Candidatus Neomarinimicrobiota bacterium]